MILIIMELNTDINKNRIIVAKLSVIYISNQINDNQLDFFHSKLSSLKVTL